MFYGGDAYCLTLGTGHLTYTLPSCVEVRTDGRKVQAMTLGLQVFLKRQASVVRKIYSMCFGSDGGNSADPDDADAPVGAHSAAVHTGSASVSGAHGVKRKAQALNVASATGTASALTPVTNVHPPVPRTAAVAAAAALALVPVGMGSLAIVETTSFCSGFESSPGSGPGSGRAAAVDDSEAGGDVAGTGSSRRSRSSARSRGSGACAGSRAGSFRRSRSRSLGAGTGSARRAGTGSSRRSRSRSFGAGAGSSRLSSRSYHRGSRSDHPRSNRQFGLILQDDMGKERATCEVTALSGARSVGGGGGGGGVGASYLTIAISGAAVSCSVATIVNGRGAEAEAKPVAEAPAARVRANDRNRGIGGVCFRWFWRFR